MNNPKIRVFKSIPVIKICISMFSTQPIPKKE